MNKKLLTVLFALVISGMAFGQSFKDIYEKSIEDNRKVALPPLREADIKWSKKIWRIIDLREKMNHPFTTPQERWLMAGQTSWGFFWLKLKPAH
jgi:hypothetical protein